jgi:hypothetical protein
MIERIVYALDKKYRSAAKGGVHWLRRALCADNECGNGGGAGD